MKIPKLWEAEGGQKTIKRFIFDPKSKKKKTVREIMIPDYASDKTRLAWDTQRHGHPMDNRARSNTAIRVATQTTTTITGIRADNTEYVVDRIGSLLRISFAMRLQDGLGPETFHGRKDSPSAARVGRSCAEGQT